MTTLQRVVPNRPRGIGGTAGVYGDGNLDLCQVSNLQEDSLSICVYPLSNLQD